MFYTAESALTYDDVLVVPNYSDVLPTEVELKTKFSRNIFMNMPIVSSAMDTVTESRTAIVTPKRVELVLFIKIYRRGASL